MPCSLAPSSSAAWRNVAESDDSSSAPSWARARSLFSPFFAYPWPWAVAALLLGAALCVMVLDGLGNIPFLRAVRPLERPQMTTVFRTYIDLSDLLPAALYSLLLSFFDIRVVFLTAGLWMLVSAWVARHLPRSM
jgi:predicted lysophospholipase L1 biosynthesis ABC-type transport system permease subunit